MLPSLFAVLGRVCKRMCVFLGMPPELPRGEATGSLGSAFSAPGDEYLSVQRERESRWSKPLILLSRVTASGKGPPEKDSGARGGDSPSTCPREGVAPGPRPASPLTPRSGRARPSSSDARGHPGPRIPSLQAVHTRACLPFSPRHCIT